PPLSKLVESLNSTELIYPPGTRMKYSNAGVATVGYVLQKTQGEPFAKYMQRAVLDPLGMKHSSFEPTEEVKKNLAAGLMWTPHGREFLAPTFELSMIPAANLYSSVNDLAEFLKALAARGKIVDAASLEQMWSPQFAPLGTKSGIGFGFFVSNRDGRRKVGHNGAMYGFATEVQFLPEDKLGAVVAISCDCANAVGERIANLALDSMLAVKAGKPLPAMPNSAPVDPALAAKLAGRWESTGASPLEITEHAGRLWNLSNIGGVRRELRQDGPNSLEAEDRIAVGVGFTTGDGQIFMGRFAWKKVSPPVPAAPPPRWAGLIGEYGEDHDILVIHERDGRLFALIEWFFMYPLTEESPNVFRFPNWGLYQDEKLVFERQGEGRATRVVTASVPWVRRPLADGGTFQIKPVRQLDGLRREALAAEPPPEPGQFRKPELVDLATLDPTLKFDIRYATTNNFLNTPFYTSAKAFMQKPAAEALLRAHQKLAAKGFGLLIHDAYRPWYVTKMFWEATPEKWHDFVADPRKGSRHNRGCAVDLTLYDLKTGKVIDMPGGYDEFSDRSYPDYLGGTSRQRWHRDLLRQAMEAEGFTVYEAEWWHFDYRDWRQYPILNRTFEQLQQRK
ncbi:MAG: M15 family metallopeptidase, partial [Gemmataceae bacterium]